MQKHHFALAVALLCAAPVYAQTSGNLPTNYLPVEQKQFGNSYQWTPANAAPSTSGAVYGPNRGWSEISNAEPKINTYQKLPFDNRASIPDAQKAKIASPFTKANFGKALTFGARQLWPIGAVITAGEIYDYLNSEGFLNARNTPEGIIADKVREVMEDPRYVWSSSRLGDSVRFSSQQAACNATLNWHYQANPATTYAITTCSYDAGIVIRQINIYGGTAGYYNYSMGRWASPCGGGEVWIDGERKCKAATVDKLNQQQIEDQIAQDAGWPTSAARALQKALEVPGNHLKTEPPTVTGPSSIPGTTTTTTGAGGATGPGAPTGQAGTPGQTTEKSDSENKGFCAQNPDLQICKDSTISGACETVTCTGDAVQCAIVKEQAKRNCELFDATSDQSELANLAIAGGLDGEHPRANGQSISLSFPSIIDQTNLLGSSCPTDVAFSVGGSAMSLPLSQMCGPLQTLGSVLVGITMLAAAFIVFRQ